MTALDVALQQALLRWWWLILILSVVGATCGYAASELSEDAFESSIELAPSSRGSDEAARLATSIERGTDSQRFREVATSTGATSVRVRVDLPSVVITTVAPTEGAAVSAATNLAQDVIAAAKDRGLDEAQDAITKIEGTIAGVEAEIAAVNSELAALSEEEELLERLRSEGAGDRSREVDTSNERSELIRTRDSLLSTVVSLRAEADRILRSAQASSDSPTILATASTPERSGFSPLRAMFLGFLGLAIASFALLVTYEYRYGKVRSWSEVGCVVNIPILVVMRSGREPRISKALPMGDDGPIHVAIPADGSINGRALARELEAATAPGQPVPFLIAEGPEGLPSLSGYAIAAVYLGRSRRRHAIQAAQTAQWLGPSVVGAAILAG